MKLLMSSQFKTIKENHVFKLSIATQRGFEDYKKKFTTARRDTEIITQKVIVETAIYIDDFDLLVYTTVCPRTSTIFLTRSNKTSKQEENSKSTTTAPKDEEEFFMNKLLAKLKGHKSHNPPTIAYVSESGCLISGEKLSKASEAESFTGNSSKKGGPSSLNNAQTAGLAESAEKSVFEQSERNRSADILIWNIQKDLFAKFEANPPWILQPSRVIEGAHYDSILSFTYLPYSQVIASSSADCTIKLWNPIARPYSLVNQAGDASVEIKPGYYKKRKAEFTVTNEPFCEVRRIYTGDQTCYGLSSLTSRIPVLSNPDAAADYAGKRMNILEVLITCNLSKTELINKRPRNPTSIRFD